MGSEMCIRDRLRPRRHGADALQHVSRLRRMVSQSLRMRVDAKRDGRRMADFRAAGFKRSLGIRLQCRCFRADVPQNARKLKKRMSGRLGEKTALRRFKHKTMSLQTYRCDKCKIEIAHVASCKIKRCPSGCLDSIRQSRREAAARWRQRNPQAHRDRVRAAQPAPMRRNAAYSARLASEPAFARLEVERARLWAMAGKSTPELWRLWGD